MTFRLFLPALSVLSALTLTGCSALDALMGPGAIDPKDTSAEKALVLYGTGVQKFQCTADTQGLWWRFITPEVTLRDEKGRKVAAQVFRTRQKPACRQSGKLDGRQNQA